MVVSRNIICAALAVLAFLNIPWTAAAQTEVKVAFIGDQGLSANARAVLQLIKDEEADFVLHQGDFDYDDDPEA